MFKDFDKITIKLYYKEYKIFFKIWSFLVDIYIGVYKVLNKS